MTGSTKAPQAGTKPSAHFCRTTTRLPPHLKCHIGALLPSHPLVTMPNAVSSPQVEFFSPYACTNPSANFGFRNRRHFRRNNLGTIGVRTHDMSLKSLPPFSGLQLRASAAACIFPSVRAVALPGKLRL